MVPAIDSITLPTSNQLLSCAQKEKVFSCFADDLIHILIWENSHIYVALGCHDDSGNNSVPVSFSLKTECDQNYGHSGQKYFLRRNRRVDYTVAALADLIITEDDPNLAVALCSCQQVCWVKHVRYLRFADREESASLHRTWMEACMRIHQPTCYPTTDGVLPTLCTRGLGQHRLLRLRSIMQRLAIYTIIRVGNKNNGSESYVPYAPLLKKQKHVELVFQVGWRGLAFK